MSRCALCAGPLEPAFSLGCQPLANALLDHPDAEAPAYPLRIGACAWCRHAQLLETVPPEAMFGAYVYRTGASAPMRRHFAALAREIPAGPVCDVGSNDGTFLAALRQRSISAYGVDPSEAASGVPYTIPAYFNYRTVEKILAVDGPVQVITLCNVLAHCPDPIGLLAAARKLLAPGGTVVVEVPYLADLLRTGAYETCYGEHAHHFSARAVQRACGATGFNAVRVQRLQVHGGSLRVWLKQEPAACPAWERLLFRELDHPADWRRFSARAADHAYRLRELCEGKRIIGYGAPAKATVLLNYSGVRPEFIVDTTPGKQGKFIPGTGTPILPVSALEGAEPDRVLLLAWNYARYIMQQEPRFRGRWIVPFGPCATL